MARSSRGVVATASLSLLLLAGCAPRAEVALEPTPLPTTDSPRSSIQVETRSAALPTVETSTPPTRVRIEVLGVDIPVEPVGVQADGQMELPPNVSIAGWYKFGPSPDATAGTTVIAAHVDSLKYGLGPFAKLKRLVVGDEIAVTTTDGLVRYYAVRSVQNVLKAELPVDEIFDRSGAPRLALITCGGDFDYDALRYSDNVIVLAEPVTP